MTESRLPRREFLKWTATATGAAGWPWHTAPALAANPAAGQLIDVNVSLSRLPVRRVPCDDTAELAAHLRHHGVTQAWAGSLDGLLHKNIGAVNARLAAECRHRGRGLFVPFGCINPLLPDWEEELRRCVEEHRMPGVRLHPNYHGYKLTDPSFGRLLKTAAEQRLVVQLAAIMEDERMMHPLLRVPSVDTTPLPGLIKETPALRFVLLNALGFLRGAPLAELIRAGQVGVEISMLEGVGGIEKLLKSVPLERVLFGSHAPLFYFESAALKLKESALSGDQSKAIRSANAKRFISAQR